MFSSTLKKNTVLVPTHTKNFWVRLSTRLQWQWFIPFWIPHWKTHSDELRTLYYENIVKSIIYEIYVSVCSIKTACKEQVNSMWSIKRNLDSFKNVGYQDKEN